ncbi:MAG: DUF4147 domain-containing protein [Pseudomonadota bacterium]
MPAADRRRLLEQLWWDAVDAVGGQRAVSSALETDPVARPTRILAVGKAANGMAEGALAQFPDTPTLVVTKHGHATDTLRALPCVTVIESAHPVPDAHSIAAGHALLDAMHATAADDHVLLLVSGGASALAEALPDGWTLDDLQALNTEMLASGLAIGEMNRRRRATSRIKGGKLVAASQCPVTVLALSDVEGDAIDTIGSGIGDPAGQPGCTVRLVASNRIARARAADAAIAAGLTVLENTEGLYDDVFALAARLGPALATASPGVHIFGGEPTVVLPPTPGRGGRNQALALALAEHIATLPHISVLVAGTDGSDGPTGDAGGVVDGDTWRDGAQAALEAADAGTFLSACGGLFTTGPTHTNVMDLAIAIVEPR